MMLAPKMVLPLGAAMLLVLALAAAVNVDRETDHYQRDMQHDHRLMAAVLASSMSRVWRSEGEAAALSLLADASTVEDEMQLSWIPHPETEPLSERERQQLLSGQSVVVGGALRSWVPLSGPRVPGGRLEVREPLDELSAYSRRSMVRAGLQVVALAVLVFAVAVGLGRVVISRPMARLTDLARRIGAGELDQPLEASQRDEIGMLAREMNQMSARLLEARRRVEAETTARLNAVEQLRHADRLSTVGKLASGVAHELGTPLNVISARAKMISTGEVRGDEVPQNATIISQQADSITRIVRQLLDFARRRRPAMATEELTELARASTVLLEPLASRHQVQVSVSGPQLSAEVDRGALQQVLTNLVLNAIQAMPRGGSVDVAVGQARATPPAEIGGGEASCATLTVRDTGPGIAAEVRPHVFEPFFTTKQVGEGTGLGLSVSWGLVRDHGGWIDLSSTPGAGTTFTVFLPGATT